MNLIQKLTEKCEREDCVIIEGFSSTTCMGWSPKYDKHGNDISWNPNWTTSRYSCDACGKSWEVKTRGKDEQIRVTGEPT